MLDLAALSDAGCFSASVAAAFQQAFLSHLLLEGFVCVQEHASQHIHIFTASDSASLWSRKYKHAI